MSRNQKLSYLIDLMDEICCDLTLSIQTAKFWRQFYKAGSIFMLLTPLLEKEAGVVPDDPPCDLGGDIHGDF